MVDDSKEQTDDMLTQATVKCNQEKADFRQKYLLKYEKDMMDFSGKITLNCQADNDLLKEAMNSQCDSKLSSLEAEMLKQC